MVKEGADKRGGLGSAAGLVSGYLIQEGIPYKVVFPPEIYEITDGKANVGFRVGADGDSSVVTTIYEAVDYVRRHGLQRL